MSINRGTLPTNYVDFLQSTQAPMRLITPEPQYFFSRLALAARMQIQADAVGADNLRAFAAQGAAGAQLSDELAMMIRAGDGYPGAVKAVDAWGKGRGDTVKFDRDVYLGSTTSATYTEASRVLTTDNPISTTGQALSEEEVPVVLKEFIGPTDSNGAMVPYAIWGFDNKFRAAKESLVSKVTRYMGRDYVKFIDTAIRDRFRATSNITYSDNVANVLSYTAGAGHQANLEMIFNGRKALSDREWPQFSNGRYMLLVPTKFNVDMLGDPDYRQLSAMHKQGNNELFGYITTVQDVDIFEVTTLQTYAAGATVPGDGNAVPTGVTVQEALLFGPGAVGFGTAEDEDIKSPEIRFADDTNFGTVAKMIWYAMHAFQTLDVRGVQRILFQ